MSTPRKSDPLAGVRPHPLFPNEPLCFAVDSKSEPEPHLVSFEDLEDPYTLNGWCSCDYVFFRAGPDARDFGARAQCSHIRRAVEYMCSKLEAWGVTIEDIQTQAIEAPGRPSIFEEGLALLAGAFPDRAEASPDLDPDQKGEADALAPSQGVPPPSPPAMDESW